MRRIGTEAEHAQLEGAQIQLVRNARSQHAVYGDVDVRKLAPVAVDGGQQVHAGVLVGGQLQVAALQALEFAEGAGRLAAQSEQAQRIVAQQHAGCGQRTVAGGAVKERFADGFFQLADDLADRRLRAMQAHSRAGEAALLGNGEKGFELMKFHDSRQ